MELAANSKSISHIIEATVYVIGIFLIFALTCGLYSLFVFCFLCIYFLLMLCRLHQIQFHVFKIILRRACH